MTKQDDRTPEQKLTHNWAVIARDKFMSGWGGATGGASRCAWAVPDEFMHNGKIERLENWVRNRSEMRNVNIVDLRTYRAPRGTAHFHVYTIKAEEYHPAF